jgi:hypothetical protein
MKCSSFEIAKKIIPQILTTEEWTTWIAHEYFHGFQFKHTSFVSYIEKAGLSVNRDSLQTIYQSNDWFKLGIDKENELLLQALNAPNLQQVNTIIDSFFVLRKGRRALAKQRLGYNTEKYEKIHETTEGTARYVEYSLYKIFDKDTTSYTLAKSDSSFQSFKQYKNYTLDKDQWIYRTAKSGQYF